MGEEPGGELRERPAGLLPGVAANIPRGQPVEQPVELHEEGRMLVEHLSGGRRQPRHSGQRLLQKAPFLLLGEVPGEIVPEQLEPSGGGGGGGAPPPRGGTRGPPTAPFPLWGYGRGYIGPEHLARSAG